MKYFLPIALLALLCLGCKKDGDNAPEGCQACPVTFINTTPYEVEIKFDGVLKFILTRGERWDTTLSSPALVEGDIQTSFAHTDYRRVLECPGDCGHTLVLIQL